MIELKQQMFKIAQDPLELSSFKTVLRMQISKGEQVLLIIKCHRVFFKTLNLNL